MSKQLFIPAVGTELTLAEPWQFTVVNEYRNKTLVEWMTGEAIGGEGLWRGHYPLGVIDMPNGQRDYIKTSNLTTTCTFPAGTVLKIDRIYLRKGNKEHTHDYDSVTFIAQNLSANSTRTIWSRTDRKDRVQKIKTKPRFFAKLEDVNKMVIV